MSHSPCTDIPTLEALGNTPSTPPSLYVCMYVCLHLFKISLKLISMNVILQTNCVNAFNSLFKKTSTIACLIKVFRYGDCVTLNDYNKCISGARSWRYLRYNKHKHKQPCLVMKRRLMEEGIQSYYIPLINISLQHIMIHTDTFYTRLNPPRPTRLFDEKLFVAFDNTDSSKIFPIQVHYRLDHVHINDRHIIPLGGWTASWLDWGSWPIRVHDWLQNHNDGILDNHIYLNDALVTLWQL